MHNTTKTFARVLAAYGGLAFVYSLQANQTFFAIAQAATSAVTNISITQSAKTRQICDCPQHELPQIDDFDELDELPSDPSEPSERSQLIESLGSRFIIKSDKQSALIITNYHVIPDGGNITMFLNDQT